jgi:hypothetical protein
MVEPSKIHTPASSDQVILSRNEYEALIGLNHKLQSDNLYLHHELEKLKRMIFGAKSERFIASDSSSQPYNLLNRQPKTLPIPVIKLIRRMGMPVWNFLPAFPVRWS